MILASSQDVCNIPGECQDGFVLKTLGTQSYIECQIECFSTPGCNYFTFNDEVNMCIVFYNCTDITDTDCPDCSTGQRDCPICSVPGECTGILVGNAFVPNENECQEACFNNDECNWYTYDYEFEFCTMTSDCSPQNSSTLKTFGQRSCFETKGI